MGDLAKYLFLGVASSIVPGMGPVEDVAANKTFMEAINNISHVIFQYQDIHYLSRKHLVVVL